MTSSAEGVASTTRRVRERIVGSTSSTVGAHSSHTVRSVGSSIALSSALAAWSVSRSASSTTITCHRRPTGASAEIRTSSRTSSTPIESCSVRVTRTSGCEPTATSWQEWHSPQPPRSHCRAAANATAALDRPEPGGPVNSHACVMSPSTARCSALDDAALPDQPVPHRSRALHDRHDQRPSWSGADQLEHLRVHGHGDLVDRCAGVEHEVVVGIGLGQPQELRAHPAVELDRLPLDAVALLEPGRAPRRARGRAAPSGADAGRSVAQRATHSSSSESSERPAPW